MAIGTQNKVERRVSELKSDLAVRLKEILAQQNLNQSELAERTGQKVSYINRVLRGATNITFESIARIEVALGMALIERASGFDWLTGKTKSDTLEIKFKSSSSNADSIPNQPSAFEVK